MAGNNNIPRQAVILAGGRGTRLRPLTDSMPKAMIPFCQKPFLEYLLEHLKEQGFESVLLLLGYLPEVIQNHFGDGSALGIRIDYSVTDTENETGRRIKLAEEKLEPYFFLMYCDNYWPMRTTDMWNHFIKTDALAQITVYTNKDNYSRSNVLVDNDGMVVCYDKTRSADNLQGVEIGFAIVRKDVLELLPDENVNFEKIIYPLLARRRQLSAYLTDHRYYSVGSYERLHLTELFLERHPAIILDRDGVLNEKPPKANYVRSWDDFKWLGGAREALRILKNLGYTIIVVSNQAGIARGAMTEKDLADIHRQMKKELASDGAGVDAIYYCPHGWDDGCECRKPKAGMLFQAQRDFNLDLSRTYFIGDDVRDEQAAKLAGCKSLMVGEDLSLLHIVRENLCNGWLSGVK